MAWQDGQGGGRRRAMGTMAAVAAVMAGVLLTACGIGMDGGRDVLTPEAMLPAGASVAVLPFENLTPHPDAGIIVSGMVSAELDRLGRYAVREGSEVRHQLVAGRTDLKRLTETTYAQEVGHLLGVDAVLVGGVSEYGDRNGPREDAVVGVNARLVRTSDGSVVWASSLSESGGGIFVRESVDEVAERAVARMLSSLGS
ncbi:hypothetical protein [Azospirillum sp. ST 5-10]|uniref:hypothetical protein n=1 Tax=unclassified Azospirillum TaxID=2630922 RepID=UPI003F4A7994